MQDTNDKFKYLKQTKPRVESEWPENEVNDI